MNRSLIYTALVLAVIGLLAWGYANLKPQIWEAVSNDSAGFIWTATNIDDAPAGGSDFVSESHLQLSALGTTYSINDYLTENIYGCSEDYNNHRDELLTQYDSSYSPDFFANVRSYYLCASVGGGDLFTVEETADAYAVRHYPYGDGRTPFTKLNPGALFSIKK